MTAKPRPAPDLPPPRIGAVLLAAGSASRMGHRPKCLLERDGVPLVRQQIGALTASGMAPVVVVLGHYRELVAATIADQEVIRVINPDPGAAQNVSLSLGLAALPDDLDGVLVTLADLPLIGPEEVEALKSAYLFRPAGSRFVRPWVDGQPGHPVLFDPGVRREMLAAEPAESGSAWAATHPEAVHRWATPNRNHIIDVDSPQDLTKLATQGIALRWPGGLAD